MSENTKLQVLPSQDIITAAEKVAQGLPMLIAMLEKQLAELDASNPDAIRSMLATAKEKMKSASEMRKPFTQHLDNMKKALFTEPEGVVKNYIDRMQKMLDDIAAAELKERREAEAKAEAERQAELRKANVGIKFEEYLNAHLAEHKKGAKLALSALSKETLAEAETALTEADWKAMCGASLNAAMKQLGIQQEQLQDVYAQSIAPIVARIKSDKFRSYNDEMEMEVNTLLSAPVVDTENYAAAVEKQAELEAEAAKKESEAAEKEALIEVSLSAAGNVQVEAAPSVSVKVKQVASPETVEEWLKIVAKYVADGKADVLWFSRNCKTALTYANTLASQDKFIEGVKYTEEIKGK